MVKDLENEVWKMISDNTDLTKKRNKIYVSNLGRVKIVHTSGRSKLCGQYEHLGGYLYANIRLNGRRGHYSVHRLVANAFCVKPQSDEKLEVNHLNENRQDNRAENLEWCTHRQNLNYGLRGELLHNFGKIVGNKRSKPILQFTKDGTFVKEWPSVGEAGRQLGISPGNICHCLKGRLKSIGGFVWRYNDSTRTEYEHI